MKKGQITIFIILGMILLGGAATYYYLAGKQSDSKIAPIKKAYDEPIENYLYKCIENKAEEAIYLIGMQGGYYDVPEPNLNITPVKIPYYYYLGQEKMPQKEVIEKEFSKYLEDEITDCVNNIGEFGNNKIISSGKIQVITKLNKNALFEVNMPLEIENDASIKKIDRIYVALDFDFNKKYDLVKKIIETQKNTPNEYPLGVIAYLANNNNFTFENYDVHGNGDMLISLSFDEKNMDRFTYSFMIKYDWANLSQEEI